MCCLYVPHFFSRRWIIRPAGKDGNECTATVTWRCVWHKFTVIKGLIEGKCRSDVKSFNCAFLEVCIIRPFSLCLFGCLKVFVALLACLSACLIAVVFFCFFRFGGVLLPLSLPPLSLSARHRPDHLTQPYLSLTLTNPTLPNLS